MPVDVKICGLTTVDAADAAIDGGCFAIGLVFFPPSPRSISLTDAAQLARHIGSQAFRVGLFVDPEDAWLETVLSEVPLDGVQLHGGESPARVHSVRGTFRVPVIKSVAVSSAADVASASAYAGIADWLLYDSRPPRNADRPGGNARAFDWSLLTAPPSAERWFLAGGLTVDNLAEAVAATAAPVVDVSSGVESSVGQKSVTKIREFLSLASRL